MDPIEPYVVFNAYDFPPPPYDEDGDIVREYDPMMRYPSQLADYYNTDLWYYMRPMG